MIDIINLVSIQQTYVIIQSTSQNKLEILKDCNVICYIQILRVLLKMQGIMGVNSEAINEEYGFYFF